MAACEDTTNNAQCDVSEPQQDQGNKRCADCFKLQSELTEVRMELKSMREIVTLLNNDLASISVHVHNLHGDNLPWISVKQIENRHARRFKNKSYREATVYNPDIKINNRFDVLCNLQDNDTTGDKPSDFPQLVSDHRQTNITRGAHARKEYQDMNVISKEKSYITRAHDSDMYDHQTIPIIVNGQTLTSKNCPSINKKGKSVQKIDHRLVIIGDSHVRLWAQNVKSELKANSYVYGLVKPGARIDTLVTAASNAIKSLTKNDAIIFCGGANDVEKNDANMAIKQINNFVQLNNHTNIILTKLLHRFDLTQSSYVNSEIRSFNRKLTESTESHNHVSILEMCCDSQHFTNHGLHLNRLGKEVMAKKIVSYIYAIFDKKQNTPILSWNPKKTSTDKQRHGIVPDRTSNETEVTPMMTPDAPIQKEVRASSEDNKCVDDKINHSQDDIDKASDVTTSVMVPAHPSQSQPLNNLESPNNIEKETTFGQDVNNSVSDDTTSVSVPSHPSESQSVNNQESPSETEEDSTHLPKQEIVLHKVSGRTRKPPLSKYEDFLLYTRTA
jgi:hypothetical protein